jgi:glutamate transport system substrate-binding protein
MKARRLGAVAAAATLALTLAACGSGDKAGSSSSGGKGLKIGIKYDQPGLGLKKGSDFTGMDVDVAKYVAKSLGTSEGDITWVQAPSAQRETLISTGQVDMVVATYSITDKRKEKVSFAGPYFIAGQDLLVRSDDNSITGPDTLAGKKLCSVTGSTSAQKVKEKVPGVNLQEFGTYSECVAALASGAIDALTTDDTILAGYAAQDQYKGKLKVVGKGFTDEKYGVGLKKGDATGVTAINKALAEMISDGSWKKALESTVGPSGYTIPSPPTPGTI